MNYKTIIKFVLFFYTILNFAQTETDSLKVEQEKKKLERKGIIAEDIKYADATLDPLKPARAAFYSAVLPGLGQAYNKQYWKIPLVYGALAFPTYFYIQNNDNYHRIRDAYKLRLQGKEDEFFNILSDDTLIQRQKSYERDRNNWLLGIIGVYILNILEANVSAHLRNYDINDDISLKTNIITDPVDFKPSMALSLTIKL